MRFESVVFSLAHMTIFITQQDVDQNTCPIFLGEGDGWWTEALGEKNMQMGQPPSSGTTVSAQGRGSNVFGSRYLQ